MPDSSPDTTTVAWLVGQALRPGDVLTNGWMIHRVERLESGSRFAVTTSPAPWRIVVEHPRATNRYDAQTARLGVWVDGVHDSETQTLRDALAQEIAERIRTIEQRGDAQLQTPTHRSVHGLTPSFYLVPGHLGDPDDLSLRALQVLATVPIIFVEDDKTEEVRALLTRFALRPVTGPGAPEIVELHRDDPHETSAVERWQTAVVAGLDTCLFGANEGLPGFCDPGKGLVVAAAAMPDAVRVRCVGGSSVLGHALMRVPSRIENFVFGGLLYDDAKSETRSLSAALAQGRLPLVVFSRGSAVREYLPGILRQSGLRAGVVHLLTVLTSDDEHAYASAAADFVPPGPDAIPDYQAVVIVIERGGTRVATEATPLRRIIARVRRALFRRTGKR